MNIETTNIQKAFIDFVTTNYDGSDNEDILKALFSMGVIDKVRCQVLAVRSYVKQLMDDGIPKMRAMRSAAKYFECTYAYIHKCMYYYKDVNI